jgi:hypothetical protein
MAMTSRERVLTALKGKEPDRVPYCELSVDRALADKLMGWGSGESQAANLESNPYTVEEAKAITAHLQLDNLCYVMRPPVYAHKVPGENGRLFYGEGMIRTMMTFPCLGSLTQETILSTPMPKSLSAKKENTPPAL